MIPILYAATETAFSGMGLGVLTDTITASVTEALNGVFELEMTYPVNGIRYASIAIGTFIKATPYANATFDQPFQVYKISKPISGIVTINAQHATYRMNYIPIMPIEKASMTAAQALAAIAANVAETCPFTLSTDITTTADFELKAPQSMRSVIGGVEGSFLDVYGGEITWDYFSGTTINQTRGQNKSFAITYGKNLTDILQDVNVSGIVTGVCPYARYTETTQEEVTDGDETRTVTTNTERVLTLTEHVIESQYASVFPFHRTACVDLTDKIQVEQGTPPTEEQLRTAANAFLTEKAVGVPKTTIQVSYTNIADFDDVQLDFMNSVNLGDTVRVIFPALGISTDERVRQTVWNVLKERYDSVVIGTPVDDLAQTIYNIQIGTDTGM